MDLLIITQRRMSVWAIIALWPNLFPPKPYLFTRYRSQHVILAVASHSNWIKGDVTNVQRFYLYRYFQEIIRSGNFQPVNLKFSGSKFEIKR